VRKIEEKAFYGDRLSVQVQPGESEDIGLSLPRNSMGDIVYAELRVALGRPAGTDRDIQVHLNGERINMPLENHSHRLEWEDDYGSAKIAQVDPVLIKNNNTVTVGFPDGGKGGIGSVVLRVGNEF